MKPIYIPKGAAGEYVNGFALNIYTGCNHRCYYCFAPNVLHKTREDFHTHVEPRKGIVEAVKRQLDKEQITDKLIHLCFTCDPYPAPPVDTTPTREIIKAIKESGNVTTRSLLLWSSSGRWMDNLYGALHTDGGLQIHTSARKIE